MEHAGSRITVGFEIVYNKSAIGIPNPVPYELTPAEAFVKGDMVTISAGKLTKATSGTTSNIVGVMAESVVAADNPAGTITYGKVYDHPDNVYRCTFSDQLDSTATGGDVDTLIDTALSTSSNDVWNGAYLYVYDGTNKGCARTVSDYVGASDSLDVDQDFPAACDTTTKYIMLGLGAEANDVINVGLGGIQLKDANTIDANAARLSSAVKVGPLVCLAINGAECMMDIMIRSSCHITG